MAANSWSFAERECAAWRRCVAMTSLGSLLSSLLVSPTMNFSIALGGKASSSAPPTSSRRPFRPLRMTPTSNATWSLERAIAPLERARPPERVSIRLGGQTGVSLEGAREMTLIGEARTERDRADPLVAGLEAHGRPIEPQAAQVGADRRSEPEAKCARQMIRMHADDVRAGVAEPVIVSLFRGLRDGAVGLARVGVVADRDIERTLEHRGERGPLVHVGRKVSMGREKGVGHQEVVERQHRGA